MSAAREHIEIAAPYRALFTAHQLTTCAALAQPPQTTVLRRLPQRANLKFTLADGMQPRIFYLKIHVLQRMGWQWWQEAKSPGLAEYHNALRCQQLGIPCYEPVAAAESGHGSMYISANIAGGFQVDHFLQRNKIAVAELTAILTALADVAAKFHRANLSHKDFYLCHFFWVPETKTLRLIDLQRMTEYKILPRRWHVKDMAALYYSWFQTPLTIDQWRQFFTHYCELLPYEGDRAAFQRRIEAKAGRIRRHDEKARRLRPQPEIQDART